MKAFFPAVYVTHLFMWLYLYSLILSYYYFMLCYQEVSSGFCNSNHFTIQEIIFPHTGWRQVRGWNVPKWSLVSCINGIDIQMKSWRIFLFHDSYRIIPFKIYIETTVKLSTFLISFFLSLYLRLNTTEAAPPKQLFDFY